MTKHLKRIGHCRNDKKQMIEEVFHIIPEKELRSMIPVDMKDLPLKDIKACCLEEISKLSDKTIKNIISGRKSKKRKEKKDKTDKDRRNKSKQTGSADNEDILELDIKQDEIDKMETNEIPDNLDLLELEMRAKAIRAMLKQEGYQEEKMKQEKSLKRSIGASSSKKDIAATSKILTSIRKKMKKGKKDGANEAKIPELEGSVDEYLRLRKS